MPIELIFILILLSVPAATAALQGSALGTIVGVAAAIAAGYAFIVAPVWGFVILLGGWLLAWMFGAQAARTRREERRHREILAEMRRKG